MCTDVHSCVFFTVDVYIFVIQASNISPHIGPDIVKYLLGCVEILSVIVAVGKGLAYRIGKAGRAEISYRIGWATCTAHS